MAKKLYYVVEDDDGGLEGAVVVDDFFKSLMFQKIMDNEGLNKNELLLMLVIFRRTVHFNKWTDKISMNRLSKETRLGLNTLRKTIDSLRNKVLIAGNKSKGGRTQDIGKYNEFGFTIAFAHEVFLQFKEIREEQEIPIYEI